jgi:spore maturation protein CgeB
MRERGFISNRVFDALACGGFVISDRVAGMDELLGDAVPTFDTEEELRELIARYLADPDERSRLARAGMEAVRAHHSFDARARVFSEVVGDLLRSRPAVIEPAGVRSGR